MRCGGPILAALRGLGDLVKTLTARQLGLGSASAVRFGDPGRWCGPGRLGPEHSLVRALEELALETPPDCQG